MRCERQAYKLLAHWPKKGQWNGRAAPPLAWVNVVVSSFFLPPSLPAHRSPFSLSWAYSGVHLMPNWMQMRITERASLIFGHFLLLLLPLLLLSVACNGFVS